ncbi:conserved exported hypothetical protein [Cupriavidus taiwanensis]|uniref:Uncharacterized protein n=1 Tax=Cupriavidus taiwanensis TaxID=164546 RepID=A0A976AXF1_9BURK|nr:hypothetical protein [Cupriavidus taiwanensis]SOZ57678.1 conserved exported hypothetical protein [Cupriavidus taiwanensis]SOZ58311.1 conserved exported hypothetical protein [Cupriavidus taiwanensis]SOZ61774.1 conserved exported hypothetical protein [Cupriavidus taiwanensis]SOZ99101.1 conserved exported hypothetical protein [Cupriavidus taiwanensis]SPA05997.1 conserved exported hypothetical protein [Cupriavidus taiwanensis]
MHEIAQNARHALIRRWVAIGILAASLTAQVAAQNHDVSVPKGMQRYVIPIKDCALAFVAKGGGEARVDETASLPMGWFRHDKYYPKGRYAREMYFSISCHPGNAKTICPKLMEAYRGDDKDYARDVQLRRIDELNPHYYSEAHIYTWSAVAPPRPRTLAFCMGNEHRAVMTQNGDWLLGYDPREITATRGKPILKRSEQALPDVLAIIRSMRFVPDPVSERDGR